MEIVFSHKFLKLLMLFFLGSLFLFLIYHTFIFNEKNNWRTKSSVPRSGEGLPGFLYLVTDNQNNKKYLLSAYESIKNEWQNTKDFTYEFLDTDTTWNPKTCAKMPSAVLTNGSFYTLETIFDGDKMFKELIRFNVNTKQKSYLDLSHLKIVSPIFADGERLHFFVHNKKNVYKYIIDDNNLEKFTKEMVFSLDGSTKIPLIYKNEEEVVLRLGDSEKVSYNQMYKYINGEFELQEKQEAIVVGDMLKRRQLANNSEVVLNSGNQLLVDVEDSGKTKSLFTKQNKTFTYLIEGF